MNQQKRDEAFGRTDGLVSPAQIDPDLKPFSPEELEDIHRYEQRMEEEEFIQSHKDK